jgi:hypothetical protein
MRDAIRDYNQLHPETVISDYYIDASDLVREVSHRQAHGLGPDLILSTTRTNIELQSLGLAEFYPMDSNVHLNIQPRALDGFVSEQGLAGIPVFIFPEVACYNRNLLNTPPDTISDLVELAASGTPIGFSLRYKDLFWTASGGAQQALLRSARRQEKPPERRTPQQTKLVISWLEWLQSINLQRNITFVGDTITLDRLFQAGELAWIPCRDVSLRSHLDHFGNNLGISYLPSRSSATPATSISEMLVMTLGRGSSAAQKDAAIDFTQFLLSRFIQRVMMLESAGILPVNRKVLVPVESSERLAAMYASFRQAVLISPEVPGPSQELETYIDDTLQSIVLGGEPVDEALDRFDFYFSGDRK